MKAEREGKLEVLRRKGKREGGGRDRLTLAAFPECCRGGAIVGVHVNVHNNCGRCKCGRRP